MPAKTNHPEDRTNPAIPQVLRTNSGVADTWQIQSAGIDGNTGFYRATIIDSATKSEIATFRESVLGTTYPALEQKARTLAAAPELLAELREVAAQYDALLTAHGKSFGWGFLATQKARELIARIEAR